VQEIQEAFEVRIQEPAADPVEGERSGEPGDARRRLAGFCNGRENKKHGILCRMGNAISSAFVGCTALD
jgi:hypothetical protein